MGRERCRRALAAPGENEARIWAGLHYRTAYVQVRQLGENVVAYMQQHYFQPLD
jgi:hypothetical protein